MECRKARYFLVTSFDGELDAETRKALGYHLKDCRACRHESFYYRELFSAERQMEDVQPSADFNEKVLARIRLREAQAAWPKRAASPRASRRRLGLVLVPSFFAAAAALTFMILLPSEPRQSADLSEKDAAPTGIQSREQPGVFEIQSPTTSTPKYAYGAAFPGRLRAPESMIQIQPAGNELPEDAFARQIDMALQSYYGSLPTYRSQERTNYVLPVLHHASSQERIY
jgi:hypothetical protein